jgi:hypothetical protein
LKATLSYIFDHDEPEDRQHMHRILKSTDMALALWEISQAIRMKHRELTEEQSAIVDEIRTKFYEELESHGLCLDELIS